jgi:glutathionylspermidine synthase
MHQEKHAAISKYLAMKFQHSNIEQKHDFERGAQTFKIFVLNDTLLLKVADEFFKDNSTQEILRLFNLWDLSEVLSREKELGVLVTQQGLKSFSRN